MAHKQSENLVYKLVLSAELEIDAEGRIWRVAKRTFDRWTGGTKVTPCTRVRAEQKTPDGYLQVRAMIDATGKPIRLEIDGGVKPDNLGAIAAAGADAFVAGSAIFGKPDYAAVIASMRAAIAGAR